MKKIYFIIGIILIFLIAVVLIFKNTQNKNKNEILNQTNYGIEESIIKDENTQNEIIESIDQEKSEITSTDEASKDTTTQTVEKTQEIKKEEKSQTQIESKKQITTKQQESSQNQIKSEIQEQISKTIILEGQNDERHPIRGDKGQWYTESDWFEAEDMIFIEN